MNNAMNNPSILNNISRKGAGFALMALTTLAAIGSAAHGGIVDTPKGFVLRSNGSMALEGNVHASGAVGALGTVTSGWGTSLDGIETGSVHTWTNPVITSWAAPTSNNVNLAWAETRSLTAGAYGSFTSNSSTTLNLGPGNYTFSIFQLGWSGKVVANTNAGDVYLYVNGGLTTDSATRFETTGPGKLFIVTLGSMNFGYQTNLQAALYSGGAMSFGGDSRLTGLAYAGGNISAGYGATFAFSNVPAPGVSALLAVAGIIGGRRRRRL
ncbi:MAG: hypothetical protein K8R92_11020 [Planctomycetes bacterium]|nr:hypothetical protein [Planctomycetota bacterium]